MKKILATLGLFVAVSLGFAGSAHAADDYVDSGVDSNGSPSSVSSTSGALPNTGGPDTALLAGGAALLAAGGTAIVVSRRRTNS